MRIKFDLGTAVLVSLLGGLLMYLNFVPTVHSGSQQDWPLFADEDDYYFNADYYGWPFTARTVYWAKYVASTSTIIKWNVLNLAGNILIGLFILVLSGFCVQNYVRKRV